MGSTSFYNVELKWETGRKGLVSSPVLDSAIEVATPPEFPDGIPGIWSPEHLLVAAVNGCFMTTFLAIAENSKLGFVNFECKASGKLEKVDGKYMISEISLSPELTLTNKGDEEKGLKILQKSGGACLISNSVRSRIVFIPEIKIQHTIKI